MKFPFTAVLGAGDMARALILASISPEIGGVLVRGEKGTAKSTMVRALTEVLPRQDVVSAATRPDRIPTASTAPTRPRNIIGRRCRWSNYR